MQIILLSLFLLTDLGRTGFTGLPKRVNHQYIQKKSPEPVTNFLKLKWEVEITHKNVMPSIRDHYLFTADHFIINARTGQKIFFPFDSVNDSLLISDTESRLEIVNVKTGKQVLNKLRRRARYVGQKEVELISDSIWIEVNYKMNIEAIDIYNEKELWSTQSTSRIADKPIIHDEKVFIANREEILVLSRYDGKIISRIPIGGQMLSKPILLENHIYMIVNNVGFVAIDLDKNIVKWQFNLVRYSGHINKIIADENIVYFSDSNLYAVDRKDGVLKWKLSENEGVFIRRPDHLTKVKDYLIFYTVEDNEYLLTIADKYSGKILYQGFNSNIVGGDRNNPDGVVKEDLLLISFNDELIDDNIIVGVMDNKIYGFEVLK